MPARLIIILIFALSLFPMAAHAGLSGFARISLVKGDVQIRDSESGDWLPASINTPLAEEDSIWCPAGARAEIQFRNGTVIRLDSESALDLQELGNDYQQVHLGMGRLYAKSPNQSDATLQIDAGDASVTGTGKTRLRVELNGDIEEVSILAGSAYVESAGQRTRVRGGETLTVFDDGSEIAPLKSADEWERWNVSRDQKLAKQAERGRHLPDEIEVYESELAENGEWVEAEEYGTVWRPTVVVEQDWAPYRLGRWVWRGGDYVWISHERWGWAPYHYGRWVVIAGRGWCWVPPSRGDVFWSPGYVAWVSTTTSIGWAPLAPGEIYYGYGSYGRHSVNITTIDRRTIARNPAGYRNVTINNAITVINRNEFVSGRGKPRPSRENLFQRGDWHPERRDMRPTSREARMPSVRPVAQAQSPPPRVAQPPAREIRERYPKLKDSWPRRDAGRNRQPATERTPQPQSPQPQAAQQTRQQGSPQTQPRPQTAPAPQTERTDKPGQKGPDTAEQPRKPKEEVRRGREGKESNRPDGQAQRRVWRIEQKEKPKEKSKEEPRKEPAEKDQKQERRER